MKETNTKTSYVQTTGLKCLNFLLIYMCLLIISLITTVLISNCYAYSSPEGKERENSNIRNNRSSSFNNIHVVIPVSNNSKDEKLLLPSQNHILPENSSSNRDDSVEESMSSFWKRIRESSFVSSRNGNHEGLQTMAITLSSIFNKLVQVELARKKTNDYYNSLQFEGRIAEPLKEQAVNLADLVATQLRQYVDSLEKMSDWLKANAQEQSLNKFSGALPEISSCCELKALEFDKYFKTQISKHEACKTVPPKRKPSMFVPNHGFNKVLIENSMRLPHVKWQYFVSPEGVHVEYPANSHNCKATNINDKGPLQQTPLNSKGPSGKKLWLIQKSKDDTRSHKIVFLIQLGKQTTPTMFKSIRNIVLLLLKFLDESDVVGIVNSEADRSWSDHLLCDQMVPVNSWTRYQITSYLNYIENKFTGPRSSAENTDEDDLIVDQESQVTTSGIQKAINMACANFSSDISSFPPPAATVIHLRSGLNSKLSAEGEYELKSVQVNCPVFIDTFFLKPLNSTEEEAYKASVQGVASKNVLRVQVFSASHAEPESFAFKVALKLNSKKEWWSLSDILSQFFPKQNETYAKSSEFSFPHWNPISKEAVVIAKKYVFHETHGPIGLVAMEIPFIYFTQHITYYVNENTCTSKNYAFLMDKQGRVIAHPAITRPDRSQEVLSTIQIDQLEVHRGFSSVKRKLLSQESGCYSLTLRSKKSMVTYAWSATNGFDYVTVLVFHGSDGSCASYRQEFFLKKAALNPNVDVQHHLLLTKDTKRNCNDKQQQQQQVSLNKASLYLAPNAFNRPADVINPQFSYQVNAKQPLALMAYIGDGTGFLHNQNRGLKSSVKDHISAFSVAVNYWKYQFFNSEWSKYILRRFGTAAGGSFLLMHPGSTVTTGYMPSSTKWFRLATDGTNKISFTPTAVDSNTGVPFSTISQVVNTEINNISTGEIRPIAVVGADLSIGFFEKLLHEIMPDCKNVSTTMSSSNYNNNMSSPTAVRCFLLDTNGYIIYHPHLTKSLKTVSKVHMTQVEPLIVIDLLQRNKDGIPMQKQQCHKLSEASATQGSLQRIYSLTMGSEGIRKSKHGEQCSRYSIVPIPNTNLFLTVVHDSCQSSAAFCPCSTVDKLCLICKRMEPNDCECPCECPREPGFCSSDDYSDLPEDIEPCEFPEEELLMIQEDRVDLGGCNSSTGDFMNNRCNTTCFPNWKPCGSFNSSEDCVGSFDCDWCYPENQNKTSAPMCQTFRECYGYSSRKEMPEIDTYSEFGNDGYSNGVLSSDTTEESDDDDTGSTLVPAFAVLSVFVVFLGLVVYCYRHRALTSSNSQPHLHLLPLQESPRCSIVPQAGSSRSDIDSEPFQPAPLELLGNRGRRRQNRFFAPPRSPTVGSTVAESDHGYSTMIDDSECGASFVLIDPPPDTVHVKHQRPSRSPPDSVEPSTSTALQATQINRILVPVTVHELE